MRERLWPYLAGIARQDKMKLVAAGGTDNHAHVLASLPASIAVAKAVQLLKCNSAGWINETFSKYTKFGWQEGYGAFSVSVSALPQVTQYIQRQEEHHHDRSFEEEFLALLQKHGIAYDSQRVFG